MSRLFQKLEHDGGQTVALVDAQGEVLFQFLEQSVLCDVPLAPKVGEICSYLLGDSLRQLFEIHQSFVDSKSERVYFHSKVFLETLNM